jgi:hypothetical protein
MNVSMTKQPRAYLPMAMSLTAFALALSHVLFGVVHEANEGTAAHLWQFSDALPISSAPACRKGGRRGPILATNRVSAPPGFALIQNSGYGRHERVAGPT